MVWLHRSHGNMEMESFVALRSEVKNLRYFTRVTIEVS